MTVLELYEKNVPLAIYLGTRSFFMGRRFWMNDLQEPLQVARIALWKAAGLYDATLKISFATFATTVIWTELRNVVRGESRYLNRMTPSNLMDKKNLDRNLATEPKAGPVARSISTEESRLVRKTLEKMDPADRNLLKMHFQEGVAYKDVGKQLGLRCVRGTGARKRTRQALVKLKELLPNLAS